MGLNLKNLIGFVCLPLLLVACQATLTPQPSLSGARSAFPSLAETSRATQSANLKGAGFLYALAGDIFRWNLARPRVPHEQYGLMEGLGLTVDSKGRVYEVSFNSETDSTAVNIYNARRLDGPPLKTLELGSIAAYSIAVDSKGRIYVGTDYANGEEPGMIEVFASGASGTDAPIRTITGLSTGLLAVSSLAVDAEGFIYAANIHDTLRDGNILVFSPLADGNAAPARTITCACIVSPENLALGADGNVYVANYQDDLIADLLVFPQTADGNTAPIWTLNSRSYGYSVALGPSGEIYLGPANFKLHRIAIYAPGASGNARPIDFIKTGAGFDFPLRIVLSNPWYTQ